MNRRIWSGSDKLPFVEGVAVAVTSIVLVGLGESLGRERSAKQAGAVIGSKLAQLAGLDEASGRVLVALGSAAGMGAVYNMPGVRGRLRAVRQARARGARGQPAEERAAGGAGDSVHRPRSARHSVSAAPRQREGRRPAGVHRRAGRPPALALLVLKPLAVAGCLRAGMPGGLFTPTLTFGAVLGLLLGAAWSVAWPGLPMGIYSIIGAGAMIAAAMQGPVSALVMMVELTWTVGPLIVPLAIAIASATAVSRVLAGASIYSG